ncbi:MAG: hypothetical protein JKY56_11445 [Kofleriaceae bacterium]|nr:hypothetical protein [Kofleriaceae bacterium]
MTTKTQRFAISPATGLFTRLVFWITRRRLGSVPTSMKTLSSHSQVFRGLVLMEQAQAKARHLPASLKDLVQIRVATLIGCPF